MPYALDQAVAGLRGLAAMLHVADGGRLHLVASWGLPRDALRTWEGLDTGVSGSGPARTMTQRALVRLTVAAGCPGPSPRMSARGPVLRPSSCCPFRFQATTPPWARSPC
ncbi:hypothetical protein ABZ922_34780 [Streptomyces shenzhenensis]|uniref:hypothetical protein n=1 Tax=Streptomyces shenzhenensis TaxID=943815 RepID=UPI0033D09F3F